MAGPWYTAFASPRKQVEEPVSIAFNTSHSNAATWSASTGTPRAPMVCGISASLSLSRPLTNPSFWITSNCPSCSTWRQNFPVAKIISWLSAILWTRMIMRGMSGTMDARTTPSLIMPLSFSPRRDVIATTGEVRVRRSS